MRRVLTITGLIIALNGCSANIVSDLAFHPPAHWIFTPAVRGREFWIDPDDVHQDILITRPAQALELEPLSTKRRKNSNILQVSGASFVTKRENIAICRGQEATLYVLSDRLGGIPSEEELIETRLNGELISAMYAHPAREPPLRSAEQSIRTICPKQANQESLQASHSI
jgi:hypothetical protein